MTKQELANYLIKLNQALEQAVSTIGSMAVSMRETLKEEDFDRVEWSKKALEKQTKQ